MSREQLLRFGERDNVAINFKSATSTLIIPAQAGKFFYPRACWASRTLFSGSGAAANISIGNGGSFPVATVLGLGGGNYIVRDIIEIALNGSSRAFGVDIGTTGISVTVTQASTYTTDSGIVVLEGFFA